MSRLEPTYRGFVANTWDALILFEACLEGLLRPVTRRPCKSGPPVESGDIFIYDSCASGISRWADRKYWSPSRILGNFLIYGEMEGPCGSGERKRVAKRKQTRIANEPDPISQSDANDIARRQASPDALTANDDGGLTPGLSRTKQEKNDDRALIGSLVNGHGFRQNGLMKKTISVSVAKTTYHLVSYFNVDDVRKTILGQPSSDDRLRHLSIRSELHQNPRLRQPYSASEHCTLTAYPNGHPQTTFSTMSQQHDTIYAGHSLKEPTFPSTSEHMSSTTLPEPNMLEIFPPIRGMPVHGPTAYSVCYDTKDSNSHVDMNSWSASLHMTGMASTLTQSRCVVPPPGQHCGMLSEPSRPQSDPDGLHPHCLQHGDVNSKSSSMVYHAEKYGWRDQSTADIRPNMKLEVRQHPETALVARNDGAKTHKPIEPLPIIQLKVQGSTERTMMSINPYLFVAVELISDKAIQGEYASFSGANSLLGTRTSSLQSVRVYDEDEESAGFFVFGDLACTRVGQYRLRFNLYDVGDDWSCFLGSVVSNEFKGKAHVGLG